MKRKDEIGDICVSDCLDLGNFVRTAGVLEVCKKPGFCNGESVGLEFLVCLLKLALKDPLTLDSN